MAHPLKRKWWIDTSDPMSFKYLKGDVIGFPVGNHPGAFHVNRKHDIHTGVDLYAEEGESVYSVLDGEVVKVMQFTGEAVGSPWWNDTCAVIIKHPEVWLKDDYADHQYMLYGEIDPIVNAGDYVYEGQHIGDVMRVLKKDKGRPTSMLHIERYMSYDDMNIEKLIHTVYTKEEYPVHAWHPHVFMRHSQDWKVQFDMEEVELICGTFDENGGKRSGFMDKALESYYSSDFKKIVNVINGGTLENLYDVIKYINVTKRTVLWWPNIDNSVVKFLPDITNTSLVISKHNHNMKYDTEYVNKRMVLSGAKSLVEFFNDSGKISWRHHTKLGVGEWNISPDNLLRQVV